MIRSKSLGKSRSISEFQFQITPQSIRFIGKQPFNLYFLYLEKGAQVIGKIEESIQSGECENHDFLLEEPKSFRIFSEKLVNYQWSIYRYSFSQKDGTQEQQYIQKSNFSLGQTFREYLQEFIRIEQKLFEIKSEKENTPLEQIWSELKLDLNKRQKTLKCTFTDKIKAELTFKCEIKCEYDEMQRLWLVTKQNKEKEKKNRRKGSLSSKGLSNRNSLVESEKQSQGNRSDDNIRESEIKIYDPEGINVTTSQKESGLLKSMGSEDYPTKKRSMLSDIIEQSYEGSSNINHSRSDKVKKLEQLDQVEELHEDIEKLSPVVKTQTFQSQRHNQFFQIKRTATLRHKASQEYEPEPQRQKIPTQLNHVSSSQRSQKVAEIVGDARAEKIKTYSNLLKLLFFVIVLILLVNVFSGSQDQLEQFKRQRSTANVRHKFKKSRKNK